MKYFITISLLFLTYKLYKANYLTIPIIYSPSLLFISVLFLFTANMANTMTWVKMLEYSSIHVSFYDSLASIGLSIFGKYIPGFAWTIVGRVGYISNKYNVSKTTLSSLSVNSQIITLWVGIILGILGLVLNRDFGYWGYLGIIFLFVFSVIIFSPYFNHLLSKLIKLLLKRNIQIPNFLFEAILQIMPWFLLNWMLWCIGFQLLVMSLYKGAVPCYTGLGFALGATFGIIAIFAPGGIGVREGILILFLTQCNIPLKNSVTISVASRLWFLIGEILFFISGLVALFFRRK